MKTKHTQGKWQVADYISTKDGSRHLAVWKGEERTICLISPKENEDEEDLTNAKLIADAGNTANKCGLLPSEILEQRNELLEALIDVKKVFDLLIHPSERENDKKYQMIVNAIKKAKE